MTKCIYFGTYMKLSVYETFKNNIKLQEECYSVKLSIKQYPPILPDNYSLSLKRFQSSKGRLTKYE